MHVNNLRRRSGRRDSLTQVAVVWRSVWTGCSCCCAAAASVVVVVGVLQLSMLAESDQNEALN